MGEQAEGPELTRRKRERGRTSPRYPLDQAVAFLRQLDAGVGRSVVDGDTAAKALGHAALSGTSGSKIGTLTHFGLLGVAGRGRYQITDLGRTILHPTREAEAAEAIASAAKTPALYAELISAYAGQAFPQMLGNILLREYGVARKKGGEVADVFRSTLEFAGLLRGGTIHDRLNEEDIVGMDSPEGPSPSAPEPAGSPRPMGISQLQPSVAVDTQTLTWPLTGGRHLVMQLPVAISKEDFDRIRKWIDLMEDVLVEKAAGEGTGG